MSLYNTNQYLLAYCIRSHGVGCDGPTDENDWSSICTCHLHAQNILKQLDDESTTVLITILRNMEKE